MMTVSQGNLNTAVNGLRAIPSTALVRCAYGFTLLELLVAMTIFSILGSIAYGGLSSILNNNEHHELVSKRLSALQTTFIFLQRDIEQVIYRPVRDDAGQVYPPLYSVPDEQVLLDLTRNGWQNPLNLKRSELQRVLYRVKDKKLYRDYWVSLDRTRDAVIQEAMVLADFNSIDIRFLDANNTWQAVWPPFGIDDPNNQLPVAVEITIDSNEFGRVIRLFTFKNV